MRILGALFFVTGFLLLFTVILAGLGLFLMLVGFLRGEHLRCGQRNSGGGEKTTTRDFKGTFHRHLNHIGLRLEFKTSVSRKWICATQTFDSCAAAI